MSSSLWRASTVRIALTLLPQARQRRHSSKTAAAETVRAQERASGAQVLPLGMVEGPGGPEGRPCGGGLKKPSAFLVCHLRVDETRRVRRHPWGGTFETYKSPGNRG